MPSTIRPLSALPAPEPVPTPTARPTGGTATALQFSEAVRTVAAVAQRHGLRAPVFRSPPRLRGVDRSIRRRPGGSVVVAVRRAGRPLAAVRADVVDGVVAANDLTGEAADRFRRDAWAALDPTSVDTAGRGTRATAGPGTPGTARGVELDDVA